MAAEFVITFGDPSWAAAHAAALRERLEALATVVPGPEHEYWLLGLERRDAADRMGFDVRILTADGVPTTLEISAHPPSIERDLTALFDWIRSGTELAIVDEDGEPSNW